MIRRPPRSTQGVSSAASDVYKRQDIYKASRLRIIPRFQQSQLFEYELASLLYDIRKSAKRTKPNGNIILEIFALNLFDSAIPSNNSLLEEKQLIIAELCSILARFPGPINNQYLSWFYNTCLLYTSPSPRDLSTSRMPSSA
eukprot:TRINITY_DN19868_c0_g1_i1.p1 TRINITY_DN19868_c0_g1~~TRINITY_DN19868_c0_g1_i1.p1  ORF type:complete len:142 (+),score=21.69 TRINITY_DN19868_c0_g1_i1:71-496(+)